MEAKHFVVQNRFSDFANIRMKCIFRFVQIQQRLKRYTTVATILKRLLYGGDTMDSVTSSNTVKEEEKDVLLAFQIAFHIVDSGDQYYVDLVSKALVDLPPTSSSSSSSSPKQQSMYLFFLEVSLQNFHFPSYTSMQTRIVLSWII